MATVTEVVAKYRADTAAYVEPVRRATAATQEFANAMPAVEQGSQRLSGATVALGAAVGGLATMAFAKATAAIKRYAMMGVYAAAEYEQTVISIEGIFQGMGLSAEDATSKTKTYLAELRDFAARTPFELPQTLDAVKRLLSIGYTADDVKDRLLPTIGDIVAALGQPPHAISAVVYAFGQMKSAGRVLGQDLMQIGNALPGFNAKMALVNEMFGGDAVKAQKAFEAGLVDSETAIDVLIKAMQKFPGAAGAMERQSKTLNGVISTFKDTVRNAMIDELMKAIPTLSGALEKLVGPTQTVAVAFATALGPNLVKVAESAQAFAPQLAEITAALINLAGGGLSNVIERLGALAPLITVQVNLLTVLANAFNLLPGPMQTLIALFIGMRVLMGSRLFGPLLTGINGAVVGTARLSAAMIRTQTTVVTGFGAIGAAAVSSMGIMARAANVGIVALNGIKAGIRSLWASLGPVGVAMIGLSVAMELFTNNTDEADSSVKDFVSSLNFVNGALDANSRQMLYNKAAQDGTLAQLKTLGISYSDFFVAITQGGPALDALKGRLAAVEAAGNRVVGGRNISTESMRQEAAAAASSVEAGVAAAETEAALKAQADSANLVSVSADRVAERSQAMTDVQNAAKTAVLGLRAAFARLNEILSDEASYDDAIRRTKELKKALSESKGGLTGNSTAALDNRQSIREAAQAWLEYAQAAKTPEQQQKRLEAGQKAIRQAIRAADMNPKDSNILRAFKEQAEQSGKTVDEFKAQAPLAAKYGIDVGANFIAGIVQALEKGQSDVTAAGYDVGAAAATGAAVATDSQSPSRVAMYLGKMFVEGFVISLRSGVPSVRRASADLAASAEQSFQAMIAKRNVKPGKRLVQDLTWALADAKDAVFEARKKLSEAMKDGTEREQAKAERDLERAIRDRADAVRQLARAQDRLAKAKEGIAPKQLVREATKAAADAGNAALESMKKRAQDALNMFRQVRESMVSYAGIDTLQAPAGARPSAGAYLWNMKSKLAEVRKFGQALDSLRKMGLNDTTLQDIIAAGPQAGLQMAQALLSAGKGMVGQINRTQTAIAAAGAKVANVATQSQYGMTGVEAKAVTQTNVKVEAGAVVINFGEGVNRADAARIQGIVDRAIGEAFDKAAREAARR